MNIKQNRTQGGFSLLEVLVAVVVLSVGLLALASLQMSLIRASGESKAQSVGLALAKNQIESMRSFQTLAQYAALTDTNATSTVGGFTYKIGTTVDRFVYASDKGAFLPVADTVLESALSADTSHTYVIGRDFKRVSVTVTWTEASGADRSLTLDDVIDGLSPADSAKVAKNTSTNTTRKAQVIIKNPGGTAGVIPIAIGDGTDTAATNPKPEVAGSNKNQSATETRFDIYTYTALNSSNALAQSRVETVVVGCTCDTATADSTATAYRPTYWNGLRYVPPTEATYTPSAGHANIGNNATPESVYCTACCRDHEDPSGVSGAKFDPRRTTHTHYHLKSGVLEEAGKSGDTTYMEACRLIRVDGILRVAADMNDEYFNYLAAKNDGTTEEYAPDSASTTNYQSFVLKYLDGKVVSQGTSSAYNTALTSSATQALESTYSINDPASISLDRVEVLPGSHKWLHSRGLFIDYLEPEAIEAIEDAKKDCVTKGCTATEKQAAVLSVMPFTSINLTEIANYSPVSADSDYISVSDNSFDTSSASSPVRGYVTPANLPDTAVTKDASASIRRSNSGLEVLHSTAIDADEQSDGDLTDKQTFAVSAGVPVGTTGNLYLTFGGSYPALSVPPSPPTISGTYISNCSLSKKSSATDSCDFSNLGSASTIKIAGYNYLNSDTTGITLSCTNSDGKSSTVLSHVTASGDGLKQCQLYSLASVSSSRSGAVVSAVTTTSAGLFAETSTFTVTPIGDAASPTTIDTLTLKFTGPTTAWPAGTAPTCTYTCSKSSCTASGNKITYTISNASSTCN